MALWFVSYATSPITVTIYDVSIVIVYDVTLLLSMTYHFQSRLGKTDCTDIWVIKLKNQVSPSIGFRVPNCNMILYLGPGFHSSAACTSMPKKHSNRSLINQSTNKHLGSRYIPVIYVHVRQGFM